MLATELVPTLSNSHGSGTYQKISGENFQNHEGQTEKTSAFESIKIGVLGSFRRIVGGLMHDAFLTDSVSRRQTEGVSLPLCF